MRTLGNIVWFVFGGVGLALGWYISGLLMFLSIIGIPWGRACLVLGQFALWPFGREAIDREQLTGRADLGTGTLGLVGNVIWFLFAGLWLSLGHLVTAFLFFLTVVGIPFGLQHIKLSLLALAPIGKTVVTSERAAAARARTSGVSPA